METQLKFIDLSGYSITVNQICLESSHDYSIQVSVSGIEYQKIESNLLFGFSPSTLHYHKEGKFEYTTEIDIWLILEPDLYRQLKQADVSSEELLSSLQRVGENSPDHILLHTESWLLLAAKQKTVAYRTIWEYFDWSLLASEDYQEVTFDQIFSSAITSFVQDKTLQQLKVENVDGEPTLQAELDSIEALFQLIPNLLSESSTDRNLHIDSALQVSESSTFDRLIHFFKAENWFAESSIEHPSILSLGVYGEDLKWNFYAKTREADHQVIFYSTLFQKVPKMRRPEMAEFITRANYGLVIGNFEMDFSDGEIRYKTSIDLETSPLNSKLIQQLAYSNLLITDKYSSGIDQVIKGLSPTIAISRIEDLPEIDSSFQRSTRQVKKKSVMSSGVGFSRSRNVSPIVFPEA